MWLNTIIVIDIETEFSAVFTWPTYFIIYHTLSTRLVDAPDI